MSKPNRTLQDEYDATRRRVARMSTWLTGPQGEALPVADWNERFSRYQEELAHLRRLGELLRPSILGKQEAAPSLAAEVEELFAR